MAFEQVGEEEGRSMLNPNAHPPEKPESEDVPNRSNDRLIRIVIGLELMLQELKREIEFQGQDALAAIFQELLEGENLTARC